MAACSRRIVIYFMTWRVNAAIIFFSLSLPLTLSLSSNRHRYYCCSLSAAFSHRLARLAAAWSMVVSAYEQQPSAKFKVKRILILISFPVKIQMNCNSNKQWMELFWYLQIRTNVSNSYNKRTSLWSVGVGDALTIYRDEAAAVRLSSLPPKQKTAFKFSSRH